LLIQNCYSAISFFFFKLSYYIWKRVKEFAYSKSWFSYFFFSLSYIIWKRVKRFAYSKSWFSYFFFSLSYCIWKRVKWFAYSKLLFSYFFFFLQTFIYNMKTSQRICLFKIVIQLFLFLTFIYNMKTSQTICLFKIVIQLFLFFSSNFHIIYENESNDLLIQNLYSAISFFSFKLSYYIWKRIKEFAYSKSLFCYFFFFSLNFHIIYENESNDLLIQNLYSAISFFSFKLSYYIWKRIKEFAYSKSLFC